MSLQRKILSRLHGCLLASIVAYICSTGAALALTLVENGEPSAVIAIQGPLEEQPEGPASNEPKTPQQYRAWTVKELNDHLELMTGARLEVLVLQEGQAPRENSIVLGEPANRLGAAPNETSPSEEGYRLLEADNRLLIGGQSDKAVLYGAYHLLRHLGVDWVMPGEIGQVVPKRKTVQVDNLDIASAPDFPSRRLWYREYPDRTKQQLARFAKWRLRQRGGTWSDLEGSAGGHMWDRFIKRHSEEFDRDPTMYALVRGADGKMIRRGPQIESTHPRVMELMVEDIKETYRQRIAAGEWTKDTAAAFPIGPADREGYSESVDAMLASAGRFDPIVGSLDRTDELVLLGNRVLEQVHKDYPNAHVGFYSYSTHADYPARYTPHPNVIPIFAPINFSRFHSLLDPESKTQSYYRDVVEQWGDLSRKQGNRLYYRGYSWNLAENMMPYSKVKIWGEELPFYHAQGFKGVNVEGTKMWGVLGASDYVFMNLAWDTSQDWRDLLRQYCEAAYGEGAEAMERYNLRLIEYQQSAGMEAGSYHAFPLIFDDDFIEASHADFDEALNSAQTPDQKQRIRFAREPLEALALYLEYYQATLDFDFIKAKAFYDGMIDLWDATYAINADVVSNEVPAYLKRFVFQFVDQSVKYSTGDYEMLVALPDEVKTIFDPAQVGHQMRFQSPEINDDHVIKTKTISSTWDAQGLGSLRNTAVWYRYDFTLPEDARDKPIGLFIGGVEDEARVWINGQFVGTSGYGFSVPFVFDLTDGVDYDGENLLAVQVVRNSKINEIGLGGIIRPSFIFTGPRLENLAPKQQNQNK